MEQLDVKYLKNEYGLSCLEDYTLYLLAKKNSYWPQIFFESYMQFDKVMELVQHGQTYSYFNGVPRLQVTGEKLGLLNFTYYNNYSFPFEIVKNDIFAMQVSKKFIKETFNKELWRNDHYILFQYKGEGEFEYLNDIPPSVGRVSTKKINEIYEKKTVKIEIFGSAQFNYKKIIQDCLEKIILNNGSGMYKKRDVTYEGLRDAIGITKVLVKRMEAFMNMCDKAYPITEYYNFLSNYYIKVEYMRAKGNDRRDIPFIIDKIDEKDKCFKQFLYKCLEESIKLKG